MRSRTILSSLLLALAVSALPLSASAEGSSFIARFNTITTLSSTVPANGDVNPYGVAVVPRTIGNLSRGNVLVSNFNNSANQQGTGTTIVQITPTGSMSLFAQIDPNSLPGACPGGVGLTTALSVLRSGWVIVGSLPTSDGTFATAQAGCLIVLSSKGNVVETIAGPLINGPWDMTARDFGSFAELFVTNVLNGTVAASPNVVSQGTVVRINLTTSGVPHVTSETVIGSGFSEKTDPTALVVGPTGVGLGPMGNLYVADSVNNRITSIPRALSRTSSDGTGQVLTSAGNLNDPLGLAIAPNEHVLTVNGSDGNLVETTQRGKQLAPKLIDSSGSPPGNGALFGLAVVPDGKGIYFVDDATNTLNLLH